MKNSLIALALAAALPFTASAAENLSYNYAEADYAKTDVDGIKADGWGVKGSYGFLPNFHAFGEYNRQEIDHTNLKVDQWKVGAGYNVEIAPSTDFVARVAYQKFDRKHGLDFNGYSTEVGVRTAFNPYVEGYVMAGYEDYTKKHGINPDGEFYGRVGATAKFNQNWGLSGEVKLAKAGDREWFVGPRFTW